MPVPQYVNNYNIIKYLHVIFLCQIWMPTISALKPLLV